MCVAYEHGSEWGLVWVWAGGPLHVGPRAPQQDDIVVHELTVEEHQHEDQTHTQHSPRPHIETKPATKQNKSRAPDKMH